MNDDRSRRVQGRAYAIWEEQGRPHGRHDDHWRQAERELGEGPSTGAPAGAPGDAPTGNLLPRDTPMAQPGAGGTGGIDSESASTLAGAGAGLGGMVGGAQLDEVAVAPGGAEALRGGPQQGAMDTGGSELGSPGDLD